MSITATVGPSVRDWQRWETLEEAHDQSGGLVGPDPRFRPLGRRPGLGHAGQMERLLGGRGTAATVKATGLGAASSSCSYAAIVIAALAIDAIFSAAGLIPESRPSIESITDRGISLNYTAVLNAVFTLAAGLLLWLTISRGATDPVCGMRVDRHLAEHHASHTGGTRYFCSPGCRKAYEAAPERYA